MRRLAALCIGMLLIIGGGLYYNYLYPPMVLKRSVQQALDEVGNAAATKDRQAVAGALNRMLTDDAQITLNVDWFRLMAGGTAQSQQFDKATFLQFIDLTLYALQDYTFPAQVQTFTPNPERTAADVTFTAQPWADGDAFFAGTAVGMRYSSDMECKTHMLLKPVRLQKAECAIMLRRAPRPGQEEKLMHDMANPAQNGRDPKALMEMLKQ